MKAIRARKVRKRLAELAGQIREWDGDRQRISHIEDHEGGAFDRWWDSDAWAVDLVHEVQDILGDAATAPLARFCSPGAECQNCAAITDQPPSQRAGRAALWAIASARMRQIFKASRRSWASRGKDLRDPARTQT